MAAISFGSPFIRTCGKQCLFDKTSTLRRQLHTEGTVRDNSSADMTSLPLRAVRLRVTVHDNSSADMPSLPFSA